MRLKYRVHRNGITFRWELITNDEVILADGCERDSVTARAAAILAALRQQNRPNDQLRVAE